MTQAFNAFEIFEIAERIERNGARYYRRAAELLADTSLKALLLSLADMEDDHERTFATLKAELAPEGETQELGESYGEAIRYLQAYADGLMFDLSADPAELLTAATSLEDILRWAIGAERESIALYVGLREVVPEDADRRRVQAIIREEMRHAALLADQLVIARGDT